MREKPNAEFYRNMIRSILPDGEDMESEEHRRSAEELYRELKLEQALDQRRNFRLDLFIVSAVLLILENLNTYEDIIDNIWPSPYTLPENTVLFDEVPRSNTRGIRPLQAS